MTTTRAIESDVIKAPISVVWGLIRELDLTFTGAVASSEVENKESPSSVGSVRKVTYKNGTVQLIKLTELSDLRNSVAWTVFSSAPSMTVSAAEHSIRLRRVTEDDTTFAEWESDFSNEVTAQYIAGARAEIKAAFANLKKLSSAEQGKVQAGVLTRQLSAHSQELKDLFHRLDKNNTGKLEIHEFRVALEQICGMGKMPDMAVNILLDEADLDKSSNIDYEEFAKFLADKVKN